MLACMRPRLASSVSCTTQGCPRLPCDILSLSAHKHWAHLANSFLPAAKYLHICATCAAAVLPACRLLVCHAVKQLPLTLPLDCLSDPCLVSKFAAAAAAVVML
jgi:hypothetical protein